MSTTVTLSEDEVHELIYAIITQDMARKADMVVMLQDKLRATESLTE
jgi:hypothetical protein